MNWMTLTDCPFFQSGKRGMTKPRFQSKWCYSWKLSWSFVLIFQLPGSILGYDNEDCQDHQFLLLKHQDVMQPLQIALKLSKFTKNEIIWK